MGMPATAATLADNETITKLLHSPVGVTVIDARNAAERKRRPLKDARIYGSSLSLESGTALVVADDDAAALIAAKRIESEHPNALVYAVAGGYAVFERLREQAAEQKSLGTAIPYNFVIPSDTCQTGPALENFEAK